VGYTACLVEGSEVFEDLSSSVIPAQAGTHRNERQDSLFATDFERQLRATPLVFFLIQLGACYQWAPPFGGVTLASLS
jgi:hypothetical protein